MSSPATPIASYRGVSPVAEQRGWNLALAFQEVLTAVVHDSSARLLNWLVAPDSSPSQRAEREEQLLRVAAARWLSWRTPSPGRGSS